MHRDFQMSHHRPLYSLFHPCPGPPGPDPRFHYLSAPLIAPKINELYTWSIKVPRLKHLHIVLIIIYEYILIKNVSMIIYELFYFIARIKKNERLLNVVVNNKKINTALVTVNWPQNLQWSFSWILFLNDIIVISTTKSTGDKILSLSFFFGGNQGAAPKEC